MDSGPRPDEESETGAPQAPSDAPTPTDSSKCASDNSQQPKQGAQPLAAPKKPPKPQPGEKRPVKKPVNKWDAVMSKISKGDDPKGRLKEVKAKVYEAPKVKKPLVAKRATASRPRAAAAPPSRSPGATKKSAPVTQVLTPRELAAKQQADGESKGGARANHAPIGAVAGRKTPKDTTSPKPRKGE
ncbi:hypothetical protein HUJ04_000115 [Dendroctonus ponderosae]|uniref:Uncharacterized protein n=2 Tax=Dendroctonus ponderosae TaxID=77166 RepID=A0AAR5PNV3_DENPD|nr:hypothetical protein HUJ04_000115 [Dendroctonus ponderosae]